MLGPWTPVSHVVTVASTVAMLAGAATASFAQATSTTPPPTQDEQLRLQLGLGAPAGCFPLLQRAGVLENPNDGNAVAERLVALNQQIGNELRAICGPSAVASASSLGGSLNSLQATKTVTQFRLVRRRIDQRLSAPRPKPPSKSIGFALFQRAPSPTLTFGDGSEGLGVFGEVEFEQRDRVDTPYESGFDGNQRGVSGGVDYVSGRAVFGGWIGRSHHEADFSRFGLLDTGNTSLRAALQQPGALTSVCGGLADAGTFEQSATRFGGFVGWALGEAGFVDATAGWTRRRHEYARSVCAIEAPGSVSFQNGTLRSNESNEPVDDIFAGVLSGKNTVRETTVSVRTGADLGNDVWTVSPRGVLTFVRAATDAYAETGRSTVANPVFPVFPVNQANQPVIRTLGGPIGFELAFDEQSRTSIALDLGAEVSGQLGRVIPHVETYWRHEFKEDFHIVTARFAQDLRSDARRFQIGSDPFDANSILFGVGATILTSDRAIIRFELNRVTADHIFDTQTIAVQARVRF